MSDATFKEAYDAIDKHLKSGSLTGNAASQSIHSIIQATIDIAKAEKLSDIEVDTHERKGLVDININDKQTESNLKLSKAMTDNKVYGFKQLAGISNQMLMTSSIFGGVSSGVTDIVKNMYNSISPNNS